MMFQLFSLTFNSFGLFIETETCCAKLQWNEAMPIDGHKEQTACELRICLILKSDVQLRAKLRGRAQRWTEGVQTTTHTSVWQATTVRNEWNANNPTGDKALFISIPANTHAPLMCLWELPDTWWTFCMNKITLACDSVPRCQAGHNRRKRETMKR